MNKKQKRSVSRILAFLLSFAMVVMTFWSDYSLAFAADDEIESAVDQEEVPEEAAEEAEVVPEENEETAVEEDVVDAIADETASDEPEVIADETAEDESEEASDETIETEAETETETEELEEVETEAETETETETETEETELVEYTLYFEAGLGGYVTSDEQILTEEDEVENVTAYAYGGYRFVNWTRDGEEYSASASITPELEDATYVANFEVLPLEFSQSKVVNGIEISLYAAPGVLPNDAVLEVTALSASDEEDIQEMIDEQTENDVLATYSFDINIFSESEGGYVQPEDGTVAVTFEAVPEADGDDTTVAVYHVDNDLDSAVQVSGETTGDSISFNAEHFSIYTITVTKERDWGKFYIKIVIPGSDGRYREIGNVYKDVKEVMTADTISAADFASMLNIPEGYKYLGLISTRHGVIEEFSLRKAAYHNYKDIFYRTVGSNTWHDCENQTIYAACRPLSAVTTTNHLDLAFEKTDFDNYKRNAKVYAVVNGVPHEMTVDRNVYHEVFDGKDYYEYRYNSPSQLKASDKIEFKVVLANGETRKMTSTTEVNNAAFERCFLNHFTTQSIFGFDYICVFSVDFKLVGDVEYFKNDGTTEMKADNLNWTGQNQNQTKEYEIKTYKNTGLTVRDNYRFAGWSTSDSAEEPDPDYAAGKKIYVTNKQTVSLYAVWTPINRTVQYKGIYVRNDVASALTDLEEKDYLNNTTVSVADARAIADEHKNGFEIVGIYTNPDCTTEFTGLTVTGEGNVVYIKYNLMDYRKVTVNYEYRYANGTSTTDEILVEDVAAGAEYSYTAKDDIDGFKLQDPATKTETIEEDTIWTFVYVQKPVLKINVITGEGAETKTYVYDGEVKTLQPAVTVTIQDGTKVVEVGPSEEEPVNGEPEAEEGDLIGAVLDQLFSAGAMTVYASVDGNYEIPEVTKEYRGVTYKISGLYMTGTKHVEVGSYEIKLYTSDLSIVNAATGASVKGDFDLEVPADGAVIGHLNIIKRKVTLTANSDSKVYDGTALTNDGYTVREGKDEGFIGEDESMVTVTVTGSQTEVGSSENKIEVEITPDFADYFGRNYEEFELVDGILTVTPAPSGNDDRDDDNDGGNDGDNRSNEAGSVLGANRGVDANKTEEQQSEEGGAVLGAGRGKSPKTNDVNNAVLWAMVMGSSAFGIVSMMAQRRKREDEE